MELNSPVFPTVIEVERIGRLDDPVLRNLNITQCYAELSSALARRTGAGANWCTFAVWASKQAGQSIRREDLLRALEPALFENSDSGRAVDEVTRQARLLDSRRSRSEVLSAARKAIGLQLAVDRVSSAVGRGNLKVFAEIGREFARFLETFLEDDAFDADKLSRFCADLRAGDPPDGQQLLQSAFGAYYRSFFDGDPKTKAELLLYANILIGLHEQTRLQPEIAESLNAALVNPTLFSYRLLSTIFPFSLWFKHWVRFGRGLLGRPTALEAAMRFFLSAAQLQMRRIFTETLMTLHIPPATMLRLGEDLAAAFPESLRLLENPDLCALVAAYDPTPDSLAGSGARDWAGLPDRTHYIIDLFRCYQEALDLFSAPFSPAQTLTLKSGRLPSGPL